MPTFRGNIAKNRLYDLQVRPGAKIAWLGGINKFWRGSKYTSNPRVWTKKQSFSSQNFTKTGVDPKKGLHLKMFANFHHFRGETPKNLGLKDSSSHKFWRDNQYLGSLWPQTALQWHRACYFLWGTILAWEALFLFVEAQVGILGGHGPGMSPVAWGLLQVYSNLSNCNYCIFVKEMLLEIGFIEETRTISDLR